MRWIVGIAFFQFFTIQSKQTIQLKHHISYVNIYMTCLLSKLNKCYQEFLVLFSRFENTVDVKPRNIPLDLHQEYLNLSPKCNYYQCDVVICL